MTDREEGRPLPTGGEEEGLRYGVLGPLELRRDGRPVLLTAAKWRMLLAVLLCDANKVVSTDRLVTELWGSRPPQSVSKLLQGYVSRVRRALGDDEGRLLVTHAHGYRAHGYRLVVGPDEVDAQAFTTLVEQAGRELDGGRAEAADARLAEALGLWRDAPFADVPPTPALEAEAVRLTVCHTQAREMRVEARLRQGRHEGVLDELETLVAEHPLRESLWGQLMLALYRSGRQADALASYRRLRDHLAEDLGIEPGPQVQRLHQRILTADPALLPPDAPERPPAPTLRVAATAPAVPQASPPGARVTPIAAGAPVPAVAPVPAASPPSQPAPPPPPAPAIVPRELPPAGSVFIGRADESSVLLTLLQRADRDAEGVAVAVIDGPGGVGKSALAVHIAHRVAHRFPDGQFYVDLHGATAGLTPRDPGEVLRRTLSTLGVPETAIPADTEAAAATFRSLVADRRILVVLDNAAGADQVRPLLPAGSGCAVLITSREMLTTLESATHLHLGVLFHDQAHALLERLVGTERVTAEPGAADTVVRMCGGLPLALRIVGARLAARPGWRLGAFAERLGDARGRLDEIRVGDVSVRASFHAGADALRHSRHPTDRAAVRAFRLLGAVPGPSMSLPAAAALLGVDGRRAEDALERLVDAHLLNSPAPGRYRMHDLLRLFAREQADAEEPAEERERALERFLRFHLTTARRAASFLDAPPQPAGDETEDAPAAGGPCPAPPAVPIRNRDEAEAWLEAECTNLMAAVTHAATRSGTAARLAARLTEPLHWYLYPHARARELHTLAELAVRIARRLADRRGEARGLDHLAAVYWLHGRYEETRACLEAALAVWRETGDPAGELRSLGNLADALAERELHEEAADAHRRQLALARETGDVPARITALGGLGRAHLGLGRAEDALACFEESLRHAQALGDTVLQGFALREMSLVRVAQGRNREAQDCLKRAAALGGSPAAYVRWRGHAWSAYFPSCLNLRIDGKSPDPPVF
ncbi:BTAD domain-containing putative transcriptional regulator [Streptomyces sp. NPDC046831]|uniref:AfsR/SARP family transcriptional regulator n=1 Tax=Streptomyces sp. NPDC046831 TaxID=3154805 RepID=UPI0033CFE0D6